MHSISSAWFLGEGSLLIQAADIWLDQGHKIYGIASEEPQIVAWAREREIAVVKSAEIVAAASSQRFDYLFSVVNMKMLADDVLRLPTKFAINFHDALLPRYAGVNAPVWAILNGETSHGVTWHIMTSGADEGHILVQQSFEISPTETAFSLNAKCFSAGIDTFRELAEQISSDTLAPIPQELANRSYFGFYERPTSAMVLSFEQAAESIERLVRALDFGTYPNPVGVPKIALGSTLLVVLSARVLAERSGSPPGTILKVEGERVVVATASQDLELSRLRTPGGAPLDEHALKERGIREGVLLIAPDPATRERLTASYATSAKSEGTFLRRLSSARPLTFALGGGHSERVPTLCEAEVTIAPGIDGKDLPDLVLSFAARQTGSYSFHIAYCDETLHAKRSVMPELFVSDVPLAIQLDPEADIESTLANISRQREQTSKHFPYAKDLLIRHPSLIRTLPTALLINPDQPGPLADSDLTIVVDTTRRQVRLFARADRTEERRVEKLAERMGLFIERSQSRAIKLCRVPLVSANEEQQALMDLTRTLREVPDAECIHTLFEAAAQRTPDKVAVTARGQCLTFRELDRRANALALRIHAAGLGPDSRVGVYLSRSIHLPVAVLGIHKAGCAYVPLDPSYPAERIEGMITDAELSVILSDRDNQPHLEGDFTTIVVDDGAFDAGADTRPESGVTSAHLAYVIYTSGSTGKPKGVMVEHRNVVNFFCAMDDVLKVESPGTWLAVTSLSFDISVLELLWSLSRGFHVVIHTGETQTAKAPTRRLDFSAFYFSAAESGAGPEQYRLLLEGARFADEHGFAAVWTPERHFHAFGGLYPNPSLASAALAMITKRVALRAGSCVSPLHSPIRIAEEWAFVDNLSGGRVGISFAPGWQPNDFCIKPENFAHRKERMLEDIDVVRRLWRGERIPFKSGTGSEVAVHTLPRPVQKELPVWITTAGNPETFEAAGRAGANVLTHLLGQTFAEVEAKVRAYRAAWEKAGHPGRGIVTLMLHTFIGTDDSAVKETVRAPMKEYLRTAVGLIKDAAWSFPTFKQKIDEGSFNPEQLSAEEMDALLDFAFERYYGASGLFGTVETATQIANRVRSIDVDEIACLIDFGVPSDLALEHLPLLAKVHELVNRDSELSVAPGETIAELIEKHNVTHFQCTPSMASMLVLDDDSRRALSRLSVMLVGGEALPATLAKQLKSVLTGKLINVYGPTETTVWSSSHVIESVGDEIPIGKPLANTEMLILDAHGNLVPPGEDGELTIGGKGVVRGYLGREELTRERFVPHPYREGQRLYRTGDLASYGSDGLFRFKGRLDHQVKVRGYRIELGEIEARLAEHPEVREAVVIAREDSPSDKRLVGYVIPKKATPTPADLRAHLAERLPEYMIPSAFVFLSSFPQTPNKKIDRKALPPPERKLAKTEATQTSDLPLSQLEEIIASIWKDVLNVGSVTVTDNFFDLGGHSLLTIQVLGRLKPKVSRPLTLIDLFRYPTIRALSSFLESPQEPAENLETSRARGAERQRIRRAMMERRRA